MANNYDQVISKTLNHISETGKVTDADLFILRYCKKEMAQQSKSSPYKELLSGAKDIIPIAKLFLGGGE